MLEVSQIVAIELPDTATLSTPATRRLAIVGLESITSISRGAIERPCIQDDSTKYDA